MKTKRIAKRDARLAKRPRLPEFRPAPAFLSKLQPGEKLTNSQHIKILEWMEGCFDDYLNVLAKRREGAKI